MSRNARGNIKEESLAVGLLQR
uniref:Uncharacterized protein n=1 Tax=Anguilla anguilla TaxID=7936 RepID=A0A0E9UIG7_ANGAN